MQGDTLDCGKEDQPQREDQVNVEGDNEYPPQRDAQVHVKGNESKSLPGHLMSPGMAAIRSKTPKSRVYHTCNPSSTKHLHDISDYFSCNPKQQG